MVTELSSSTRWLVTLISVHADLPVFAEAAPGRHVERGVRGKIVALVRPDARTGKPIHEARAVVHIGREPRVQRKRRVEAGIQRVALIVIDGLIREFRRGAGLVAGTGCT